MTANEAGEDRRQPSEQPAKRHGDPLLDAATGKPDADSGTRHGFDAVEESRRDRGSDAPA